MTQTSLSATNASNPAQELEALVAKIDSLTQLSLEMTRLCIDAQGKNKIPYPLLFLTSPLIQASSPILPCPSNPWS
jgi:hypothetical protein